MVEIKRCNLRVLSCAIAIMISAGHSPADPLSNLDQEFRRTYAESTQRTLQTLRDSVPVLVNRFGQIALYRPGSLEPEIYTMDQTAYLRARSVAHAVATLVVGLSPYGTGNLSTERREWLKFFEGRLLEAEDQLRAEGGVARTAAQADLVAEVRRTVQGFVQRNEIREGEVAEIGRSLRNAVRFNLGIAAASQLDQFREQVSHWRRTYPLLNWGKVVIVVLGNHQARRDYLQTQFFDWLTGDEPDREDRVVYAETMTVPPPLEQTPALDALTLLAKVTLDKGLSLDVFGDPLTMQTDVLGPVAKEILQTWPKP